VYRLFVAIDLPEETKEAISALRNPLRGVRWVDAAHLHLTLRFIGDADNTLFNKIRNNLSGISVPPFSLLLRGVGYFPPKRDPKVLWVGVDRSAALLDLQSLVEKELLQSGVEPERRSFSPHITIARLKETPASVIAPFLQNNSLFVAPSFSVTEFILYSSTLTSQGAIHRQEALYPLRG
jgi:RNA 2',3'-cyclic 3'-phosphodiesterase